MHDVKPEREQPPRRTIGQRLRDALVTPIKAMRRRYLPLLMVYFSYGALGITAVAQSFWIKRELTLSPSDLAALAVWLTVPWTVKMVFGQFVDCIPILGSRRRAYVYVGAAMVAAGMITLAGAAGGWISVAAPDTLYVIATLLTTSGVVLQDVVADAMSTEVVDREAPDGSQRPKSEVERELGLVQVLGRLALSLGIFLTAGLAGWLAQVFSYETVFLLGLFIPAISVTGATIVRLESSEQKPIDWRILGGGLTFGAAVVLIGVGGVPFGQELVFVVSMAIVGAMLVRVTAELDRDTRMKILFAVIIIFVFRASPGTGEGYRWFTIDTLGFDEAFYGTLAQIGAGLAMAGMWLLSDAITRQPVAVTLLWLTVVGTVLSLPNLALVYELHHWTEQTFGIGARTIALLDTTVESPFAQLSMIPLLTLIAIHAPEGRRATWFALMASFMNLALVAGQLQTKYFNQAFEITRGSYEALPLLVVGVIAIGFIVPVTVILLIGRRVT
jgi:hypothetical protein